MAIIYASAPGTGSGGAGTVGDPYTGIHQAMKACSAGDSLYMVTGVYTQAMSWNSLPDLGGWPVGTGGSPITVRPVTFTADTTRGIPGGTSSVIWRTGGGSAVNMASVAAFWNFYGIDFDATNLSVGTLTYISHNGGVNNIRFRNCTFSNRGITSATPSAPSNYLIQHLEYSNNVASTALMNNTVEYCEFTNAASYVSHDIYCRSSGNIFQNNDFHANHQRGAIQFFASNGAGYAINDNIVRFNYFRDYPDIGSNQAHVLFSLNCNRNLVYCNEHRDSTGRAAIDFRGGSGVSGAAANNAAYYNTVHNGAKGIAITDSGFSTTKIKNNIAYACGASAADNYVDNGTSTDALTNGFDGTDPKFADAAGDDYTLGATSPYLSGGTALGSPYDDADFLGVVRDNRSYGAYEDDLGTTPVPPINVYPNPAGYTITKNVATVLTGLSVTDNNSPSALLTECWLSLEGTNATWTAVDTSGGATSN